MFKIDKIDPDFSYCRACMLPVSFATSTEKFISLFAENNKNAERFRIVFDVDVSINLL